MARVVCTRHLPVELGTLLPHVQVVVDERTWQEQLVDAEALVVTLRERLDAQLLSAAPRLAVVASYSVGVDHIDLDAASALGICVTNTPDVLTDATADFTFALLLAAARRLGQGERLVRSGNWTGWEPTQLLGLGLRGATLVIVGAGRIGKAVAARAVPFGMTVRLVGRHDALLPALRGADVVSVHCPLTKSTRHLIDAAALAQLPSHAIVINTARGPIVDETAVLDALDAGTLGAAAFDVYEHEPSVSERLRASDRVILAPHLGSATIQVRTRMAEMCAASVRDVLRGVCPQNLVNSDVWNRRRERP